MIDRKKAVRLAAIAAAVAVLVVGLVLALSGRHGAKPRQIARPVQKAALLPPPPAVEPTIFAAEAPETARASNAAVPIVTEGLVAAKPFHFTGSAADRAAAEACLTAALLYEAGDDAPGEKAVAQVVLNRLRHPVFPKTVCGVIQQGSERKTGCQFTFTCDGALARPVSPQGWQRARAIAKAALDGAVYKPVGTATHYHTDYVVPYWRSSLQKIAVVHTQIFYRWPGPWGSRNVLTGRLQPGEQVDPRIARLAGLRTDAVLPMAIEQAAQPLPKALEVAGLTNAALNGNLVRLKDEDAGQFVLQLSPNATPASWVITAFNLCGDKLECMVFGWTDAGDIPRALPVVPWMMRSMAFAYRKSRTLGIAQGYWDCRRFPRPLPAQCLKD
jgi:spore germination cell wall hydrolase CwlJ-like protein